MIYWSASWAWHYVSAFVWVLDKCPKMAQIQQRAVRILKRRYTSHTQVERPAKTIRRATLSQLVTCIPLPPAASSNPNCHHTLLIEWKENEMDLFADNILRSGVGTQRRNRTQNVVTTLKYAKWMHLAQIHFVPHANVITFLLLVVVYRLSWGKMCRAWPTHHTADIPSVTMAYAAVFW